MKSLVDWWWHRDWPFSTSRPGRKANFGFDSRPPIVTKISFPNYDNSCEGHGVFFIVNTLWIISIRSEWVQYFEGQLETLSVNYSCIEHYLQHEVHVVYYHEIHVQHVLLTTTWWYSISYTVYTRSVWQKTYRKKCCFFHHFFQLNFCMIVIGNLSEKVWTRI